MPRDYFKEDILENAISNRQRERSERREDLRKKRELQEKRNAEAAARAKRRRRFLAIAALLVIIAAALVGRSIYRIIELQREKARAEAELAELQEKIERLNSELKRVSSDEYIEQQARTQLKMIFPGETLYIVVPPEKR
ncbi:MAG: septum formation initiator family protein [Firmicutes bacterium]|nr:septum formation initiator family protein [Bacillota bacterium]MBR3296375.1 septum formation initiator family protein [Bacillota bacterium]